MIHYNFDEIIDRRGTFSLKWEYINYSLPNAPADALPLWVADMDFPCAQPIIDALKDRIDHHIFGYSVHANETYYAAVIGWFKRRFDWEINPMDLFYSPGVVPAIGFLIDILSQEGDGIIIQPPVYYPFAAKINNYGRKVVPNLLCNQDGHYTMDFADLEAKLSRPENKGLILCSPHNPVGRVWRAEELQQVVKLCQKYAKWIISDEIHCDLIRAGENHLPLAKLCPEYKEHIFTCTAPSKTFNLAGMQLSNIIIHNDDIKKRWQQNVVQKVGLSSPNALAITAAIAAYNHGEDWLNQLNHYLDENIRFVTEFVKANLPKVKVTPCQGTYLMWLDFTAYGYDAPLLEKLMQQDAKIALDEGYIFGQGGEGFERINIACPRSILADCLNRIKNVFA